MSLAAALASAENNLALFARLPDPDRQPFIAQSAVDDMRWPPHPARMRKTIVMIAASLLVAGCTEARADNQPRVATAWSTEADIRFEQETNPVCLANDPIVRSLNSAEQESVRLEGIAKKRYPELPDYYADEESPYAAPCDDRDVATNRAAQERTAADRTRRLNKANRLFLEALS
jgi:hypothetical protein